MVASITKDTHRSAKNFCHKNLEKYIVNLFFSHVSDKSDTTEEICLLEYVHYLAESHFK